MQEQVLAGAQHDDVHHAVGIDVERIGARHGVDLHCGRIHRLERERAGGLVAEERGGVRAAGDEEVGIAVERRHTAADEIRPVTGVGVRHPSRGGRLDEGRGVGLRRCRGRRGRSAADGQQSGGQRGRKRPTQR